MGALMVIITPFVLFWILNKIFPVFGVEESH